MSAILRPHRSPSPAPASPPPNPSNPAKLTRQSLGPPPTTSQGGAARGFTGLGITSPTLGGGSGGAGPGSGAPRHVSSSVAMGYKETLSPRPSMGGSVQQRAVSQFVRPSSEFLGGGSGRMESKTPETEQLDQWFMNLSNWESTLEEMAQVSNDQNFTEELGAIEQWFRVLSEAERTAALYSLLQHSTPMQIRFFISVLHHMSLSDPSAALISPTPQTANTNFAAQMDKLAGSVAGMKSPSAGGGAGFSGGQYLSADANGDAKLRAKQNRISAPGTLQPNDRWQNQLDQVAERGASPALDGISGRARSPALENGSRPKSTDFSGLAPGRSPRVPSGNGVGLGFGQPDAATAAALSPLMQGTSWASMVNSPLAPVFQDPSKNLADQLNLASLQLAAQQQAASGKVNLDDARKFRRPGVGPAAGTTSRNVSATYDEDGNMIQANSPQPGNNGFAAGLARSPAMDQYGFSGLGLGNEASQLNGLGMGFGTPGLGGGAAQLLALAQAQQQLQSNAAYSSFGNSSGFRGAAAARGGRRSPMMGSRNSPAPDKQPGGGAGGGAGVAGPDDVDMRVVEDVTGWLRVLRLHKYTTNFAKFKWTDMIQMNDQDLTDNGVSAQGARTKFLKVFYNVRERQGIAHPPGQEEYAPGAQPVKE